MTIHKVGNQQGKILRTGLGVNKNIIATPSSDIIQSPQTSKLRKGLGRNVQSSTGGDDSSISDGLKADLKYSVEIKNVGAITTTTGGILASRAYTFGQYYSAPSSTETQFGNKDWSVALLFKSNFTNPSGYFYDIQLACDQFNSGRREFSLGTFRDGSTFALQPVLGVGIGGTQQNTIISFFNNTWSLLILNHIASTKTLNSYLNNVLAVFNYTITLGVSGDQLVFGARNTGSGFDGFCTSTLIQYLYKWDRVLTSTERDYLYNSGAFRFV